MKLRSGKVLLPLIINKKIKSNINEIKKLLINEKEFEKGLLKVVLESVDLNNINTLSRIIKNSFDEETYQNDIQSLIDNGSSLIALLLGQSRLYYDYSIDPIFHDEIESMILGEYNDI
jgi:hypothetical protein